MNPPASATLDATLPPPPERSPRQPEAASCDALHKVLDAALDASVRIATGDPSAGARVGQRALSHDILDAMLTGGTLAGEAPTGSGKSLAALTPALVLAAVKGERTVVSTESLGLQEQYLHKDVPVVIAGVAEALGDGYPRPSIAVLKGWANHACTEATAATVAELTGTMPATVGQMIAALAALPGGSADLPAAKLARWAAEQIDADLPAERSGYPDVLAEADWAQVSVSTAECPGVSRCRFGSTCRPAKAREAACEADVVVTNHSMLAVQAANAIPVVVGNDNLGSFDHLVVDEAHALPAKVRDHGSTNINAYRVAEVAKAAGKAVVETQRTKAVLEESSAVGSALDEALTAWLDAAPGPSGRSSSAQAKVAKISADDNPLADVADLVAGWAGKLKRLLPRPSSVPANLTAVSLWRAHAKVASLVADLSAACEARSGVARWVEEGRNPRGGWTGATLKLAPVNSAGPLRSNLYQAGGDKEADEARLGPDETDGPEGEGGPIRSDDEAQSLTMSVAAMSATLPAASVADLGLPVACRQVYPSPFADAYGRSWLFVPKVSAGAGGAAALLRPGGRGVDTGAHPGWATPIIETLVAANGGRALVLAATVSAGKRYVEALRSRSASGAGWAVHSQWDGLGLRATVDTWRDDHDSVLVGTKSLMTGVDAPGATCTLVVVDRVPRAAGNPVDDARVEDISERLGVDRYSADRSIYVADAALLLEQAAGRLVRATTDGGVVAILDPRLLKVGGVSYPAPARKLLLGALERFERRSSNLEAVCARMASEMASHAAM